MTSPGPEQRLRAAGLRVTAPRLAVLAEVQRHSHADVDTIAGAVRELHHTVSTQAVYDVLRVLTEHGITRRIEPAGSPARYDARVGDNHHHLVCRSCGTIRDVDCAVGEAPCLEPVATPGFTVDEADVTFWGRCPACQAESQSRSPSESQAALTSGAAPTPAVRHTQVPEEAKERR